MGAKAGEIDRYKLWHNGRTRFRNGVSILVKKELVDQVVKLRRKSNYILLIKLVVRVEIVNVRCVNAPQIGLANDIKGEFWEELEEAMQSIHQSKKLFLVVILMHMLEPR